MIHHLPECYQSEGKWDGGCICDRLRAREQRVRHEGDVGPNRGGVHHELCGCDDDEPLCEPEDCPYCSCWRLRACEERVLDAAREAVDSMVIETAGNSAATVNQALAAIDALREKPLASGGIYAGPPIPLGDGCVIPKSDAIDALKEKP